MRHLILLFLLALHILPLGKQALAQGMVQQIHALYFGEFAVTDDAPGHTIAITTTNVVTADPVFVFNTVDPARYGQYEMTGFTPNTNYYLDVEQTTDITLNDSGAGPEFEIINIITSAPDGSPLTTDGDGDATFYVGGMLRTTGSSNFDRGLYSGTVEITLFLD